MRGEDGMWAREGEPLSFTLTFHQNLETSQKVVINLQSQLQKRGSRGPHRGARRGGVEGTDLAPEGL